MMLLSILSLLQSKKYYSSDVPVEKKSFSITNALGDISSLGDWMAILGLSIMLIVVVYHLASGDNPEKAKKLVYWWFGALIVYVVIKSAVYNG